MGRLSRLVKGIERFGAITGDLGAYVRKERQDEKEEKSTAASTAASAAAAAPGIEMARRNAIPLMQDDTAIEAAKKRALTNQQSRSGRASTMLSAGLGK